MKKINLKKNLVNNIMYVCLSAVMLSVGTASLFSQTVEKVADLSFGIDQEGDGYGQRHPVNSFTQVGSQLWFTTQYGGLTDQGTISLFDLPSHEVQEVADLNNTTGSQPYSSLLVISNLGYFTTSTTGAGNRGTIDEIDLTSGAITPLFAFPNNGLPSGYIPRASLTQIGNELWTITELGGISNRGVVINYNLTNQVVTAVTNLDGRYLGAEAFAGFTAAGNTWYFATFAGGNTFGTTAYPIDTLPNGSTTVITDSLPLGAGTLGQLTFDDFGNPVVSNLVSLPGGYDQFPALAPIVVGNSLYFTSVGPNALPGAILRYDLSTGFLTNLFNFSTNPIPASLYGTRPGYSGLTAWQGELYFITYYGGTNSTGPNSGGGTVDKFNIASNTVIKLADLGNAAHPVDDLGSPSGFYGTGTIVQETNRFYIYYPLSSGGVNNQGTIIRVLLPPPPIQLSAAITNATNINLSWSGGYPPFDVLTNGDVSIATNWAPTLTNITSAVNTTNWSVTLPFAGGQNFYLIRGQAQ